MHVEILSHYILWNTFQITSKKKAYKRLTPYLFLPSHSYEKMAIWLYSLWFETR